MSQFSQASLRPLYLLVGKDDFLKEEFITTLRNRVFAGSQSAGLDFQRFSAGEDTLGAALDFLRTVPFLSPKRMAVVQGIDALSADEKEAVLSYADKPPASGVLMLVSEEGNAKKDSFLKALAQKAERISCYTPFDRDLPVWIQSRIKKTGKTAGHEAAQVLIDRVGKDTAALSAAVEQLTLFTEPRKEIASKDVELLFGRSIQGDVFALIDRLLEKDSKGALEILEMLFREGGRSYEIIGALASQFDRLLRASELVAQNRSKEEIGAELNIHPYYLDKSIRQARMFPPAAVKHGLRRLLGADESIKNGRVGDRLAVESFILEFCARPASTSSSGG